jgi:phenylalanyl-tRNA synthetase beta chain
MEHALFNNALEVRLGDERIGVLGNFKGADDDTGKLLGVYCEINIPPKLGLGQTVKYEKVSAFPTVERDLSLLIDANVLYEDIDNNIMENAGKYLIYSRLYDIYEGKSIASGKKSLTFRLVFQNQKRTLTEKEIDKDFKRILKGLEGAYNATLREAI